MTGILIMGPEKALLFEVDESIPRKTRGFSTSHLGRNLGILTDQDWRYRDKAQPRMQIARNTYGLRLRGTSFGWVKIDQNMCIEKNM